MRILLAVPMSRYMDYFSYRPHASLIEKTFKIVIFILINSIRERVECKL